MSLTKISFKKNSLIKSLALTYLALTLVTAGLLYLVTHSVVRHLENNLQQIDMGMAIARIRNDYLSGNDPGRPNRFFYGAPYSQAFPEWLRDLDPGFYKRQRSGRTFHIIVDDYEGTRYLLIRDYTDYEHYQLLTLSSIPLTLGGSLILALVLGLSTTRRVIKPITQLAKQIQQRHQLPAQSLLAAQHPTPNEIRELAQAFDATYNQLEQALQRERLFTTDISHNLRTPLAIIATSCELMRDDLSPDMMRQQVAQIEAATTDLQQQFDCYLILARNEAKTPTQDTQNLFKVAHNYQSYWHQQAQYQGVAFQIDVLHPNLKQSTNKYPTLLLKAVLNSALRHVLQHTAHRAQIKLLLDEERFIMTNDSSGSLSLLFESTPPHQYYSDDLGSNLSLVLRICQTQGWVMKYFQREHHLCSVQIEFNP